MENKKEDTRKYVENIVEPIFNKHLQASPHAKNNNLVLVGGGRFEKEETEKSYLWQPHNFRRYYSFSKENYTKNKPRNKPKLRTYVGSKTIIFSPFKWDYAISEKNFGSEHHFKGFNGCTIKVRKNTIEITLSEIKNKWFRIYAYSEKHIDQRIDQIIKELEDHCKRTLELFLRFHGGKTDKRIVKKHSENKIKGIDYLDKIPIDMIIHDSVMKKVYKEKNVEIYGEARVKNLFKNATLEKFSPEIANSLGNIEELNTKIKGLSESSKESINETGKALQAVSKGLEVISEKMVLFAQAQAEYAKNNESHLALIHDYRQEMREIKKPFFIRWFEYFKRSKN